MEMKVRILGADSFGARSMAAVVEAGGLKIVIDPGVSYAPRRYGLPPHPLELKRLGEIRDRIIEELRGADYVVITHYHYDHYLREPELRDLYSGKLLFVKDPRRAINLSQKLRAHRFLKKNGVENVAENTVYADNQRFTIDEGFEIAFSPPVPHGAPGTRLGNVIMVAVKCCDATFVHASDVQGPVCSTTLRWILAQQPDLVFISGPPTYFAGFKVPEEEVRKGLEGLKALARSLKNNAIIIADHHFARDIAYTNYMAMLNELGEARVVSAAEYMGMAYEPLEALRKELWGRGHEEATDSDRASGEPPL